MSCKPRKCFVLLHRLREDELLAVQSIGGKNRSNKRKGTEKQRHEKSISRVKDFDIFEFDQSQEDAYILTRSKTKYARKKFTRNCGIYSKRSKNEEKKGNSKRSQECLNPKRAKISELPGKPVIKKTRSDENLSRSSEKKTEAIPWNLKLGNENKDNIEAVCSVEAKASKHPYNSILSPKLNSLLLTKDAKHMKNSSLLKQPLSSQNKKVTTRRKKIFESRKEKNTTANCSVGSTETKGTCNSISIPKLGSVSLRTNKASLGAEDSGNSTRLMQQYFPKTQKPHTGKKRKAVFNNTICEPSVLQNNTLSSNTKILKRNLPSRHSEKNVKTGNTEGRTDFDIDSMIYDLKPNVLSPTVRMEKIENSDFSACSDIQALRPNSPCPTVCMENNNRDFPSILDVQVIYPSSPCPTIKMEF